MKYYQGWKDNWHYRRNHQIEYSKVVLFILLIGLFALLFVRAMGMPGAY